jgi:hypothetical protein
LYTENDPVTPNDPVIRAEPVYGNGGELGAKDALNAWVAYEDVPDKEPVNIPVNDPLNEPVFDKN